MSNEGTEEISLDGKFIFVLVQSEMELFSIQVNRTGKNFSALFTLVLKSSVLTMFIERSVYCCVWRTRVILRKLYLREDDNVLSSRRLTSRPFHCCNLSFPFFSSPLFLGLGKKVKIKLNKLSQIEISFSQLQRIYCSILKLHLLVFCANTLECSTHRSHEWQRGIRLKCKTTARHKEVKNWNFIIYFGSTSSLFSLLCFHFTLLTRA